LADLRGASIGIGPEGSGTAYLLRQLFEDPDLRGLDVRLSYHELDDQARLVGQGKLDLAAVVMEENAALLRTVVDQYDLDAASFQDLEGLVARQAVLLGIGFAPPKTTPRMTVAAIAIFIRCSSTNCLAA
jgi:hypothetical protein